MKKIALLSIFLISYLSYSIPAFAKNGAVILLFHRFNESKYPSTNISSEQLDKLISYIKENNFTVVPLNRAVNAMNDGEELPEKSIVITIDDGFKSVYNVAFPKFSEANFPFTVFLSSKKLNNNIPAYMSWDDVSKMSNDGVDFQAHTVSHSHMTKNSVETNRIEIEENINDIAINTGISPTMFSFPFGETNNDIINEVKSFGFIASFGQHSGVYNSTSNKFYIPRFSINEKYSSLKRFNLILNTKPFPIEYITPSNTIHNRQNPPQIEVKVTSEIKNLKQVACYRSDTGKLSLEKSYPIFYIDFQIPFSKGNTRINCTMPDEKGGYKWLGMQFTKD